MGQGSTQFERVFLVSSKENPHEHHKHAIFSPCGILPPLFLVDSITLASVSFLLAFYYHCSLSLVISEFPR